MLLRLWHVLTSHHWRIVSRAFNPPFRYAVIFDESDRQAAWGFTEILESCDCGVRRRKRLIGNHATEPATDELSELRKIAGLSR